MDDETAEIELLQQNLHKTRQLSKKMTTILDSFDTRIAKLEKSILPLYTASQILNRRRANIDRTLEKIDDVATNQEDLSAEESLILRGPQPGQLQLYKEAMERLNANIAFKGSDPSEGGEVGKIADLITTGTKRLAQMYTKIVAESSSSPPPSLQPTSPGASAAEALVLGITLDPQAISSLTPIARFLRTLPVPGTHPNHPAAGEIGRILGETLKGYAEMRGGYVAKCMDAMGKKVVIDASEGRDSARRSTDSERGGRKREGREFGEWVEGLVGVVEEEHRLLLLLSPLAPSSSSTSNSASASGGPVIAAAFASFLQPILRLFGSVLSSLVSLMKRRLEVYGFLALAAYESLLSLQPLWEQVISYTSSPGSSSDLTAKNEFKDGLPVLRSLCLRSFPEFLADIKLAALPKTPGAGGAGGGQSETSTRVVGFVGETVTYISKIPDVQGAVSAALLALGDGNWKMGEGVQVGAVGKRAQPTPSSSAYGGMDGEEEGPDEGREVLEHYIHDVISTALASLTTISKTSRRPAFGAIFLLNNIAYLRIHLISSPTASLVVSKSTLDLLQSNFRMAKAGYYDANFTPLMQAISDAPPPGGQGGSTFGGLGGAKGGAKDKFIRFYDVFDEVVERHRIGKVLSEEGLENERHVVEEEVVSLVVPSLRRFIGKAGAKSKGVQKYVKKTPEEIESEIRTLFG
ncbi:hypothetical protein FA13DRAFT_1797469 [Coprinellus micaceus]|uniref:Exocyst complex protein EXO70 n=1 Tax=Coprinellus micaceus TaxID=71717 RepID=A0A4Y7SQF2_COPMI|nr:hypothetical protein FA13DRAFT_1797469 [Coprinellus micaceus]